MADFGNYIQDVNKFKLAGPPEWFCRQLYEFDPSLVIVPSRMGFFYRLGQRRKLKLPESVVNDVMKEQADTHMLAGYSLIPVTTVMATVDWGNPYLFVELQRRAPWRMGGAKKFEDQILAQERAEALTAAKAQNENLDYLAKDSWKFYQKLIGTRSHLWSPATKNASSGDSNTPAIILPSSIQNYRPKVQSTWLEPKRVR